MNGQAQQNGQQVDIFRDMRDAHGWLAFGARCLSAPSEIWLRRIGTVGERYHPISVPIGFLLYFLMSCYIGSQHPMPDELFGICFFFVLTSIWLIFHRVQRVILRSKGQRHHSLYWGDSVFDRGGRRLSLPQRALAECLVTWGFAILYMPLSSGMGITLLVAGVALVVNAALMHLQESAITRSMHDALIEARVNAERI